MARAAPVVALKARRALQVTVCISCGCDDLHACEDGLGDACYWVALDIRNHPGVCSECATRVIRAFLNIDQPRGAHG
jgi:hypothetical protein